MQSSMDIPGVGRRLAMGTTSCTARLLREPRRGDVLVIGQEGIAPDLGQRDIQGVMRPG